MAKLVDLKRSLKDAKKDAKTCAPLCVEEQEQYPWGARINLREEELSKLGIDVSGMKAGGKVSITATGEIIEVSSSKRVGGKDSQRLEIQITKLAIEDSGSFEGAFKKATEGKT